MHARLTRQRQLREVLLHERLRRVEVLVELCSGGRGRVEVERVHVRTLQTGGRRTGARGGRVEVGREAVVVEAELVQRRRDARVVGEVRGERRRRQQVVARTRRRAERVVRAAALASLPQLKPDAKQFTVVTPVALRCASQLTSVCGLGGAALNGGETSVTRPGDNLMRSGIAAMIWLASVAI